MRLELLSPSDLRIDEDLVRAQGAKQFEERLQASILQVGLAEPLKAARTPAGTFVVIDGVLRLRAIRAIREVDPSRFQVVPTYVYPYEQRFEIRFQTDIYQDLLPSQMAQFVEHLHESEHVTKGQIAKYIGVSAPTLRNYTGLARMLQRGGLFSVLVEFMDLGILPSSNPYAWLRLTDVGVRAALQGSFCGADQDVESWIADTRQIAKRGEMSSYSLKFIEHATGALPPECYREDEETRSMKRDLGLRRSKSAKRKSSQAKKVRQHLDLVAESSADPVLRAAASSLSGYLR